MNAKTGGSRRRDTPAASRGRDTLGRDLSCASCGRPQAASELDRLLWCPTCLAEAHARAKLAGRFSGLALAGALAAWIYFVQDPSRLVIGGWIGAVVATLWLGARAGRELFFGVLRFRRRPTR